jgi:hypothetical protein
LVVPFELGTNGAAFGNIVEINFASGFVASKVETGISTTVGSVVGNGDSVGVDCSSADIIGVDGDI